MQLSYRQLQASIKSYRAVAEEFDENIQLLLAQVKLNASKQELQNVYDELQSAFVSQCVPCKVVMFEDIAIVDLEESEARYAKIFSAPQPALIHPLQWLLVALVAIAAFVVAFPLHVIEAGYRTGRTYRRMREWVTDAIAWCCTQSWLDRNSASTRVLPMPW